MGAAGEYTAQPVVLGRAQYRVDENTALVREVLRGE